MKIFYNFFPEDKVKHIDLNVTQVVYTFLCPRRFYISYYFQGKRVYNVDNTSFGKLFHKVLGNIFKPKYYKQLLSHKKNNPQLSWDKVLAYIIFQKILFQELENQNLSDRDDDLTRLIDAIHKICKKFSEFFSPSPNFKKFFYGAEIEAQHKYQTGENSVSIKGRVDGVIFTNGKYYLLEYKMRPEQFQDKYQIAFYWRMLKNQGMETVPLIFYFYPNFEVVELTEIELQRCVEEFEDLLPYLPKWISWTRNINLDDCPPINHGEGELCDNCPQKWMCSEFFPSQGEIQQQEENYQAQMKVVDIEGKKQLTKLVETINQFGISVEAHGFKVGPTFLRLEITMPEGESVNKISKLQKDLVYHLGLKKEKDLRWGIESGVIYFEIPREQRQTVYLKDICHKLLSEVHDKPVSFPAGVKIDGTPFVIDFSSSSTCHLLVAGTTGSGKTEFIVSMLCFLCARNTKETLNILLIDPKYGGHFRDFEDSELLKQKIIHNQEQTCTQLENMVQEMEFRYQKFRKNSVADITQYNKKSKDKIPHILVVLDEFADLVSQKEFKESLTTSLKRLGAKARAAGIHLVLATQSPTREVVTSAIKNNLPARVALKVTDNTASRVILDRKGAENLLGQGDMIVNTGSGQIRLQSPYVPKSELKNFIS